MSEVRRILSTSFISLLLVIWGLFMVCSGRVPTVAYDDEFAGSENGNSQSENPDLMAQLAFLDEEPTKLEDFQRREILEALGIDPSGADLSNGEQDFLSEELFLDLEVEIAELEKLSGSRNSMLDSLRLEMQEADHQLAALGNLVDVPKRGTFNIGSTNQTAPRLQSNSEYATYYQDALDDVYGKRFDQAIVKFQDLLRQSDSYNSDNLADNAQYWIGECNYALGNYQVAIAEFERVFAFDNNNKIDDAQFMIGITYLKAGDPRLAQLELSNLLAFYQESEYITRAEREFLGLNI